jgi:23S rRNA (cytosine1962-C5)-methyltransferase
MLDKIEKALQARAGIRATDTDALRIVDGTGDGFNDLAIDDFAGNWLVETKGVFPEWLKAAPQPASIYWKKLGDKESPRWIAGAKQEEQFVVSENGIKYWIDFTSGYSQGIFLDQRDNRLALRQMAAGKKVLNLFAYTCAFGVSAALGGGDTVNLDLSKRYLEWGKRNYALNGLDPEKHDFIYGDVADWLKRFRKKERKFDIILLDPPTFSRNDKGAIFTIEEGFTPLVEAAAALVAPGGTLMCCTNQRTMSPSEFRRLITDGLEDLPDWDLRFTPIPSDFSGEDYLKTWWLERCA